MILFLSFLVLVFANIGNRIVKILEYIFLHASVQFSRSVVSNCLRPHGLQHARLPCPPRFLELTQTHVHWGGDAIQAFHPLVSPSPHTFNYSQHQGNWLFQWVSSSHQVAKVLAFQLQHQSFQWTIRTDFLEDGLVGFPCSPTDSEESSPTPQFKSISSLVLTFFIVQLSHP